jgi:hypothetical protein
VDTFNSFKTYYIAEGAARKGDREFIQFIPIAFGSLVE